MGSVKNCIFCCRNRHLVISFFFLLISSSTQDAFKAEGRRMVKPIGIERGQKKMERSLIGSRPPRCAARCRNCGHCEAIQVPIAPQHQIKPARLTGLFQPTYSRGDDLSNYKPLSWKCKCGDLIFNP